MSSLTEQMELLQKQQEILAEKIKDEELRKRKLNSKASIERLEALIEPITQHLNYIQPGQSGTSWSGRGINRNIYNHSLSRRENINNNFNRKKILNDNIIKYNHNQMLANEEIFVTLLGIIKKQDARIRELEGNKRGSYELELPCNR